VYVSRAACAGFKNQPARRRPARRIYSSRNADEIGNLAARIAGNTPPANPMIKA
jgi:hypothetical protein